MTLEEINKQIKDLEEQLKKLKAERMRIKKETAKFDCTFITIYKKESWVAEHFGEIQKTKYVCNEAYMKRVLSTWKRLIKKDADAISCELIDNRTGEVIETLKKRE